MATNSVRNSSATGGISILIDQAQEQLESGRQLQQKQQQQQQQQRHATAKNNISPFTTTNAATETTCEVSTASTTSGGGITMLATSNKCNSITSNNSTTFIDINCNEDNVQKWRSALELQKTAATQATAPFSQLLLRAAQATSHVQDNNHNNDEETSKVTTTTTTTSSPTPSERRKTKAEENQKNGHKVHGVGSNSVGISITHEQIDIDAHICNAEQLKPVANDEVVTTTIIACNSIQERGEERDDHHHHVDRVHGYDDGNDNEVVESRLVGRSSGGAHSIVCVAGGGDAPDFGVSGRPSASLRQQADQLEDIVAAHSLQAPDCVSALTESVASNAVKDSHVVKIKISPNSTEAETTKNFTDNNAHKSQYFKSETNKSEKQVSVVQVNEFVPTTTLPEEPRIELLKLKIPDKMVQKPATPTSGPTINSGGTTVTELNVSNPSSYLYYMMSSGQFSPCDTLDSGTGSDLESMGISNIVNTAPSNSSTTADQLELHLKTTKIRVHPDDKKHQISGSNEHSRGGSLTDSEESESSLSCDSLNSSEYLLHSTPPVAVPKPPPTPSTTPPYKLLGSFLPDSLLRDIRDRKFPTNDFVSKYVDSKNTTMYDVRSVEPLSIASIEPLKVSRRRNRDSSAVDCEVTHADYVRERNATNSSSTQRASLPNKTFVLNATDGTFVDTKMNSMPRKYEADKYYDFHVNEHENFRSFGSGVVDGCCDPGSLLDYELRGHQEDAFAGYKDVRLSSLSSTIRSSKGTVRGVKNRVRNGIATFLQLQHPNVKNYKEKDLGKVVLYTTSMGIIRDTYAKCSNVKQILRTLLVKFEERDVFMSVEYQQEIKERMHSEAIKVPQLFVEGQHIGDAETVERLNESGELRQLLKPYKSISTAYTCQTCGGYRLLPCPSCNGSKKSVHRNHFTAEFVALKCMNCDEVGLVKCHNC